MSKTIAVNLQLTGAEDVNRLSQNIENLTNLLDKMAMKSMDAGRQIESSVKSTVPVIADASVRFNELSKQIEGIGKVAAHSFGMTKEELKYIEKSAMMLSQKTQVLQDVNSNANRRSLNVLNSLNYTLSDGVLLLQDWKLGLMAVGNNIQPLLISMQYATRDAGSFTSMIGMLKSSLTGVGGVVFGLSLLMTVIQGVGFAMGKKKREVESAKKAVDEYYQSMKMLYQQTDVSSVEKQIQANKDLAVVLTEIISKHDERAETAVKLLGEISDENRLLEAQWEILKNINDEVDSSKWFTDLEERQKLMRELNDMEFEQKDSKEKIVILQEELDRYALLENLKKDVVDMSVNELQTLIRKKEVEGEIAELEASMEKNAVKKVDNSKKIAEIEERIGIIRRQAWFLDEEKSEQNRLKNEIIILNEKLKTEQDGLEQAKIRLKIEEMTLQISRLQSAERKQEQSEEEARLKRIEKLNARLQVVMDDLRLAEEGRYGDDLLQGRLDNIHTLMEAEEKGSEELIRLKIREAQILRDIQTRDNEDKRIQVQTMQDWMLQSLGVNLSKFDAIREFFFKKDKLRSRQEIAQNAWEALTGGIKSVANLGFPANLIAIPVITGAIIASLSKAKSVSQSVTAFADGGVITEPTMALLGEATYKSGAELVTPEKTFVDYMNSTVLPKVNVGGGFDKETLGKLDRIESAILKSGLNSKVLARDIARYNRGMI